MVRHIYYFYAKHVRLQGTPFAVGVRRSLLQFVRALAHPVTPPMKEDEDDEDEVQLGDGRWILRDSGIPANRRGRRGLLHRQEPMHC